MEFVPENLQEAQPMASMEDSEGDVVKEDSVNTNNSTRTDNCYVVYTKQPPIPSSASTQPVLDHRIVGNLFNVHGHFTNQFFLPFLNLSTLAFILSSQAEFRENRRDREWPSGTGRPGQQFCNLMCSNYVGTLGICKRNSVYLQCAMFSAMNQFYQEMCIHR